MLVIGWGGAGYAVASTAARLGKRVSMAEHGKLGRTCRDFFQRCPILHSNPSGGALPSRQLCRTTPAHALAVRGSNRRRDHHRGARAGKTAGHNVDDAVMTAEVKTK